MTLLRKLEDQIHFVRTGTHDRENNLVVEESVVRKVDKDLRIQPQTQAMKTKAF